MVNFLRVIVLWMCCSAAFAAQCSQFQFSASPGRGYGFSSGWLTLAGACSWYVGELSYGGGGLTYTLVSSQAGVCTYRRNDQPADTGVTPTSRSGDFCGAPVPSLNPIVKSMSDLGVPIKYSGKPSLCTCFSGTSVCGGFSGCTSSTGVDNCALLAPYADTGVACSMTPTGSTGGNTATTATSGAPPEGTRSDCPIGSFPGTVNGVSVCAPAITPNTIQSGLSSSTVTISSPDGSTSSQSVTSSKTVVTSCEGASCTTTTSVTAVGADGRTATTAASETESKDEFCKVNPKSSVCITSSFGGACASGFSCEGDAVQCALSKEVFLQNCKLNAVNSNSQLFDVESLRSGNLTANLPGNATVQVGPASFSQSNLLGVGPSCISDLSVTVLRSAVVLPFSKICPWLDHLGLLSMAVSFLLAARILFRG